MPLVSMKELLEAGVHFGHQTRRWNPKMKPYIYDQRNGIYIIDLHKTRKKLEEAFDFVKEVAYRGGKILFVGTKKQAQDSVMEAAQKCGMYFVNQRWLGGMLTNWNTIRQRIERLNHLQQWQRDGVLDALPKKESARLVEEMDKLRRVLGGIKEMGGLPQAVIVLDLKKEHIAVREARKLEIPIVGLVDTNCDPDEVDYVIPGNDDAIRALRLMAHQLADAALEGLETRRAQEEKAAADAEQGAAAAKLAAEKPVLDTIEFDESTEELETATIGESEAIRTEASAEPETIEPPAWTDSAAGPVMAAAEAAEEPSFEAASSAPDSPEVGAGESFGAVTLPEGSA